MPLPKDRNVTSDNRLLAALPREEYERLSPHLELVHLAPTRALLDQITRSAVCNRFHTVEERLCRWLLISRDRARDDTLPLTQEFLSHMLGVPRASVTASADEVQQRGLISYGRGKIVILDRAGLAAASCECYRRIRDGIERLRAARGSKNLPSSVEFRQTHSGELGTYARLSIPVRSDREL